MKSLVNKYFLRPLLKVLNTFPKLVKNEPIYAWKYRRRKKTVKKVNIGLLITVQISTISGSSNLISVEHTLDILGNIITTLIALNAG